MSLQHGDAGDAIDFACDHLRDDPRDFLEAWREGRLEDYPEYTKWIAFQRKCASEARQRKQANCSHISDAMLEEAEERLFGAAKRIARTMGAEFILNEQGQQLVRQAAMSSALAGDDLIEGVAEALWKFSRRELALSTSTPLPKGRSDFRDMARAALAASQTFNGETAIRNAAVRLYGTDEVGKRETAAYMRGREDAVEALAASGGGVGKANRVAELEAALMKIDRLSNDVVFDDTISPSRLIEIHEITGAVLTTQDTDDSGEKGQ